MGERIIEERLKGRVTMSLIGSRPLRATVVGSYPTGGAPPGRALKRAVEDQIAAGVELIADGQVRGDMIESFASRIPGFERADDGVWEVRAALDQPHLPITAGDYALARQIAGRRAEVKGVVTGPITLALSCRVASSAPYTGPADPALLLRLAELLGREVAALVAAGARVVQVDEPLLPQALSAHDGRIGPELAHDALRDLAALPRIPMLHVCGDIRAVASELLLLPFDILDIEQTRLPNAQAMDPDELEVAEKRLCVGVVDTQSSEVESVETIRERIRALIHRFDPQQLWVAPDCGLRLLEPAVARQKLANMVLAVHDLRAERASEV